MNSKDRFLATYTQKPEPHEFFSDFKKQVLAKCCQFAEVCQQWPEFINECVEAGYGKPFLDEMKRIGLGNSSPRLLLDGSAGAAVVRRVPDRTLQEKYIEEGVTVLCPDLTNVRMIPIGQLDWRQIAQAFDGKRVRTQSEQRTWLEREQYKTKPVEVDVVYKANKNKVTILKPCELTRRDLLRMLEEME